MTQLKPIILIPARMGSTRLPNKPLADIDGIPMIVQVMRRAEQADIGPVIIAAAEQAIVDVVEHAGGKAVLTDPAHPSGTDRINEALHRIDTHRQYNIIINVQGDLPTLDPTLIRAVLEPFRHSHAPDISTLAARITREEERTNPNVVKPVVAWDKSGNQGNALYFSRATVPHGEGDVYHHIGLYAYTRAALERFVSLPPSPLERREKLEQLRALENGMRITVVAADTVPLGVDTAEDLERARKLI